MKIEIIDVRKEKRWQLEARLYGENMANAKAMARTFQNDHYEQMNKDSERIEKWRKYLSHAPVDDLIATARDLFELIENECKGTIEFIPGAKVWQEGPYTCVDYEGKGKKGTPISWYAVGNNDFRANLHHSSDTETEIWRRINHKEPILNSITVFENKLSPDVLTKYLGEYSYHRDFGHMNGMPRRVESAFNHIPSLKRSLKVKGFPYPHKVSNIMLG